MTEQVPGAPLPGEPLPAEHIPAKGVSGTPVPSDHAPDKAVYAEDVPGAPEGARTNKTLIPKQTARAAHDAKAAQQDKAEQAAADKETLDATNKFAAMHGDFLNAVDALGDSHETRMAKSHADQAMEWIQVHLHPDPETVIPWAPPPAPPFVK